MREICPSHEHGVWLLANECSESDHLRNRGDDEGGKDINLAKGENGFIGASPGWG